MDAKALARKEAFLFLMGAVSSCLLPPPFPK